MEEDTSIYYSKLVQARDATTPVSQKKQMDSQG